MGGQPDVGEIVLSMLVTFLRVGIFVFLVVLVVLDRRALKANLKTGLLIGAACLLLLLPNAALTVSHINLSSLVQQADMPPEMQEFTHVLVLAGVVLGLLFLLVRVPWYALVYGVAAAEWSEVRPGAFPILRRSGRPPWGAVAGAAVFGAGYGVLSLIVLSGVGVEVSESVQRLARLAPGVRTASPLLRWPAVALAVTSVAIAEELIFRGALLGWLLRVGRQTRIDVVMSAVLVSLLWALMHVLNTNAPLLKCIQIFVFGLILCKLATCWCFEAAVVAHVGLNLSASLLGFLFTSFGG